MADRTGTEKGHLPSRHDCLDPLAGTRLVLTSCLTLSFLVMATAIGTGGAGAQVVPDRSTPTSAATEANGRVTVTLAPANRSGISHNAYEEFSASRAGVGLNNRGVDASTIVNEVTSTRRSHINGPIEVLGSRAHVVIANPNGITIDGGRFVNTGGVALSTGPIRYEPGPAGSVNVVARAGAGDIAVGEAGLSGSMTALQLIAASMKIGGPISNDQVSPSASIGLWGGRSEAVLDSSVSPLTTLRPWAARRALAGEEDKIVVDVTALGSLRASKISIAVSGRGAGVSFSGRGLASIGDFNITADGKIRARGAVIRSEKSVKVEAQSIELHNGKRRQSLVSSVSGSVRLTARAGDIDLHGQVNGARRSDDDPDAMGGVTLAAARDITLRSEDAGRLAIAFAADGDLYVEAGRNLRNDTGRLLSNAAVVMKVAGSLHNVTGTATTDQPPLRHGRIRGHGSIWSRLLGRNRLTSYTEGTFAKARIPGQMAYISGATIDIRAGTLENSGEIDALQGSALIHTSVLKNVGIPVGGYRIEKRCSLICWTHATSNATLLGGVVNVAGSAILTAGTLIENGGQITSYGNLILTAPRLTGQATFLPEFEDRPEGLYNGFSGTHAILSMAPAGGMFLAPSGTVTIRSEEPVLLRGGVIEGAVGTFVPGGTVERVASKPILLGLDRHIGLLSGLLD